MLFYLVAYAWLSHQGIKLPKSRSLKGKRDTHTPGPWIHSSLRGFLNLKNKPKSLLKINPSCQDPPQSYLSAFTNDSATAWGSLTWALAIPISGYCFGKLKASQFQCACTSGTCYHCPLVTCPLLLFWAVPQMCLGFPVPYDLNWLPPAYPSRGAHEHLLRKAVPDPPSVPSAPAACPTQSSAPALHAVQLPLTSTTPVVPQCAPQTGSISLT